MTQEERTEALRSGLSDLPCDGERVLLVVPDTTRTAPVAWFYREIRRALGGRVASLDVMIALGTHQPMSDAEIAAHLGRTDAQPGEGPAARVYNHRWDEPDELAHLGTISADEIERLSGGLLREALPVTINRRALEYDRLLLLSPVFPHELVGFSGGYKYLFPGISGPEVIDLTHWLAALAGNLRSIGRLSTPARDVIHAAAGLVPVRTSAICTVIVDGHVDGVYVGGVIPAWERAAHHSQRVHIAWKPRPFARVLACAPRMYDDLWTGGKAIYKCEPVVADGGELVVYAPHITSLSVTHERPLLRHGYHCIEYFLRNEEETGDVPRMIRGVASYVYGAGSYDGRVETPRIRIRLATGIPASTCAKVGLGYVDPESIDPAEWRDREKEGILCVDHAGERLFRLEGTV